MHETVKTTDEAATLRPSRDHSTTIGWVLCSAANTAMLDVFVVNVAFSKIGDSHRGSSPAGLSRVLNGYAIVYAALLVPAGRFSDRFGRKAGFLVELGVFTPADPACAPAPSLWALVAFRLVQAVGAAAAFGPVVGGALVEASWRWIFLSSPPVGVVAGISALRMVPDLRQQVQARVPDLLGVVSPALFRVPTFVWANTTAPAFCTAFGAWFLGIALWPENAARSAPSKPGPPSCRGRSWCRSSPPSANDWSRGRAPVGLSRKSGR